MTELIRRAVQVAMCGWAVTIRFCVIIIVVVAATAAVSVCTA
jgi:hypothetical protein